MIEDDEETSEVPDDPDPLTDETKKEESIEDPQVPDILAEDEE